ncbi:MAG: hypothetical protein LUC44_03355 [Prevotellaceae bacterium]|nr:hypothetical protein [Prevotellaceae bacterium]
MQAAIDNAYASATGYADALSSAANAYTDSQTNSALGSANSYTDSQTSSALSSANSYTDAQTAAANAYAEAQAAAAQAAAIAAAQESVEAAASTLQSALSAATSTLEAQGISINEISTSLSSQGSSISDLQANVAALVSADATLTEGITTAQARADEAYELAQSAQTLAETNKANLETLQSTVNGEIASLQTQIESAQSQIDGVSANLSSNTSDLQSQIDALNTLIESLGGEVASSVSSTVTSLQEQITAVNELIADKQSQIDDLNDLAQSLSDAITANSNSITSISNTVAGLQTSVNTLDSQVSVLQGNVQTVLTMATNNAADISSLTTQFNSLSSSNESLRYALVTQLKTYVEDLQSQISSNSSAISHNSSDITTINETLEKLQKALETCESKISSNSSAISTNAGNIATNAENIATNTSAISELREQISELKGVVSSLSGVSGEYLDKLLEVYGSMEDLVATSQASILATLGNEVTELTDYIDKQVSATNKNVTELQSSLEAKVTALQQSIEEGLSGLEGSIEANVTTLQESIDATLLAAYTYTETYAGEVAGQLSEDIATAQDAADTANASIEELKNAYAEADDKLQDQIDEIVNVYLQDLADKIDAATTDIQTNADKVADLLTEYAKSEDLAAAQHVLDSLATVLGLTYETLTGVNSTVDIIYSDYITQAALEKAIDGFLTQADIEGLASLDVMYGALDDYAKTSDLSIYATTESLQNAVLYVLNTVDANAFTVVENLQMLISGNFNTLKALIDANKESIGKVSDIVETLQSDVVAEAKRLKSMVYIPKSYVGGIACIDFVTLTYTSWTNPEANRGTATGEGQNGGKEYFIDDKNHTEEYFVNPSNCKSSIESLSFVSNNAKTRVNSSAPISIVAGSESYSDEGILSMKITKTDAGTSLSSESSTNITIVALKATIKDDFLTDEEKEAGTEVAVYSDWARVCETSVTPYIHNALLDKTANGKLDENEDASHFWTFTEVYNGSDKKVQLPQSYNGKHIADKALYNEDYDLMQLVTVCDKNGTEYTADDLAAYGLEFQFDMDGLTYYLQDEATGVYTDQELFAKVVVGEDGKYYLRATSKQDEDGNASEKNASAVGREPLVRVELIDTNNGNAIVDVCYFKIQWVNETTTLESLVYDKEVYTFDANFTCGGTIDVTLEKMTLNNLFAWLNDEAGMSQDVFRSTYDLNPSLYATQSDAKVGTNPVAALGKLTYIQSNSGSDTGNTDNIEWKFSANDLLSAASPYKVTKSDLGTTKTFTAWGYFEATNGTHLVFEVEMNLTIPSVSLASNAGYLNGPWANSYTLVYVNPSEYDASTSTTCAIEDVLLHDFTVDGNICDGTNYDIYDLVSTSSSESVNDVMFKFVTGNGYYASADGATLYLDSRLTQAAATLDPTTGEVKLIADDYGKQLVGKTVNVELVADYCSFGEVVAKEFEVKFLEPLNITPSEDVKRSLGTIYDLSNDKSVELSNTYYLQQNYWDVELYVATDYVSSDYAITPGYASFYEVQDPYYDLDKATWYFTEDNKTVTGNPLGYSLTQQGNELVYERTLSTTLAQEIDVKIPVTITTKWQTFSYTVSLTIQKGAVPDQNLVKRK